MRLFAFAQLLRDCGETAPIRGVQVCKCKALNAEFRSTAKALSAGSHFAIFTATK
jgi:hypothetical protein